MLSRSSSKHKTGNANAYIGSSQFIVQENLSVFMAGNDCAEKSRQEGLNGEAMGRWGGELVRWCGGEVVGWWSRV
jgi:hypothetical protein